MRFFCEVWFAFINFVGDELHHPLDFFSNKMRTRLVSARPDSLDSLDLGGPTGTSLHQPRLSERFFYVFLMSPSNVP